MAARRARLTLSDQLSILDSSKLRDLLKTRDDNSTQRQSITLATVLASEKNPAAVAGTRRLLDILRDEEGSSDASAVQPRDPPPEPSPAPAPAPTPAPVRVSLMALLEQGDRLGGGREGEEEEVVGVEVEKEKKERGGTQCCVCMVRDKGAAFIPCGHTFCRLCSRELWISRGNCPLCNGFILEILDIF
ncbi:putative transcription factor C2H2 family [Dioscorea sansibarensis]